MDVLCAQQVRAVNPTYIGAKSTARFTIKSCNKMRVVPERIFQQLQVRGYSCTAVLVQLAVGKGRLSDGP